MNDHLITHLTQKKVNPAREVNNAHEASTRAVERVAGIATEVLSFVPLSRAPAVSTLSGLIKAIIIGENRRFKKRRRRKWKRWADGDESFVIKTMKLEVLVVDDTAPADLAKPYLTAICEPSGVILAYAVAPAAPKWGALASALREVRTLLGLPAAIPICLQLADGGAA